MSLKDEFKAKVKSLEQQIKDNENLIKQEQKKYNKALKQEADNELLDYIGTTIYLYKAINKLLKDIKEMYI